MYIVACSSKILSSLDQGSRRCIAYDVDISDVESYLLLKGEKEEEEGRGVLKRLNVSGHSKHVPQICLSPEVVHGEDLLDVH